MSKQETPKSQTVPVTAPVKKEHPVLDKMHVLTNNAIAIVFALGFAYLIFNSIDYAIRIHEGRALDTTQWVAVILAIVLPLVIALLAYTLARRQSVIAFLFIQATGLALAAAYWLNVVGYLGLHTV